jgi:sialic acid synthase SpsE
MILNFTVNGKTYNRQKALIIAELGTSHGADPAKGRELIDAAAEAGADCVKFQIVYADEILHPNTGEVSLPGGKIRLYDRFKRLEVDLDFFAEMKARVEDRGLLFLCTPFGLRGARELGLLAPQVIKIASPELNYTALLKEIASYDLPVLLSTGVSKLGDIEEALEHFPKKEGEDARLCLLHCVTAYPAPEKEYNLKILGGLSGIFGLPVGISDHSLDPELVPVLGIAMGAAVIEKHFCLSREDSGLDDPIALPPKDFGRMVRAVRGASAMDAETLVDSVSRRRGKELVLAVLGDGVKRLAPSERASYERTNRSLHALRNIKAGEIIEAGAAAVLRTERILRPGLPPSWESKIAGRQAKNFIPAGEGIRFEDVF